MYAKAQMQEIASKREKEGRERERKRERETEYASWGMMAKLLRAVSQLGWLARCVSVRFVRRLTAWSRRDKARPTLPLGFCSGLISYPPAPLGHPRGYAVRGVFRDSHPHAACTYGVRLTTWSSILGTRPPCSSLPRRIFVKLRGTRYQADDGGIS